MWRYNNLSLKESDERKQSMNKNMCPTTYENNDRSVNVSNTIIIDFPTKNMA